MAGTCSSSQVSTNGRPVKSTSTTGFPVLSNSCNSALCTSGISRLVRELLSPLISDDSPSRGNNDIGPGSHFQSFVQKFAIRTVIPVQFTSEHGGALLIVGIANQIASPWRLPLLPGHRLLPLSPSDQRGSVIQHSSYAPGARHVGTGVRQRTDYGNGSFLAEWQHTFILQQHKALRSSLTGNGTVFLGEDLLLGTIHVAILIRIVKQSQLILRFQNTAARRRRWQLRILYLPPPTSSECH